MTRRKKMWTASIKELLLKKYQLKKEITVVHNLV